MSMFTPRGTGSRPLRRRRVSPLRATVALGVVVAVGAAAWLGWQSTGGTTARPTSAPSTSCATPSPVPEALPPQQVKVNVFNATDRRGLAAAVARGLRQRGFVVGKVDNDPARRAVRGLGEVRHGSAGAAAARTVAAQVGTVAQVPDGRTSRVVDLVLGPDFRALQRPGAAAAMLSPSAAPPAC